MTRLRLSLTLATALAAAALAVSGASAADTPDLVGTWKSTGDHAGVFYGEGSDYTPETKTPTFRDVSDAWTIVIKEQKGRAFHGVSRSPKGEDEVIVGAISADGQHLIMAGDDAGLFGYVIGDKIEFCYKDEDDDRAAISCFVGAKE